MITVSDLTPVSEYSGMICELSQQFKLGLTEGEVDDFVAGLPDHTALLQPTSIGWFPGRDADENFRILTASMRYQSRRLGIPFEDQIGYTTVSYSPGNESAGGRLTPALLDIGRFRGIPVAEARQQLQGEDLASMGGGWLVVFNMKLFAETHSTEFPNILLPGFSVFAHGTPSIERVNGKANTSFYWGHESAENTAPIVLRK